MLIKYDSQSISSIFFTSSRPVSNIRSSLLFSFYQWRGNSTKIRFENLLMRKFLIVDLTIPGLCVIRVDLKYSTYVQCLYDVPTHTLCGYVFKLVSHFVTTYFRDTSTSIRRYRRVRKKDEEVNSTTTMCTRLSRPSRVGENSTGWKTVTKEVKLSKRTRGVGKSAW